MAREQAYSTKSPLHFVIGAPILNEDAREVIKMLNWANGHRPQLHISQTVAPEGWESNAPVTHDIEFRASGSSVEVFRFRIKVLPETVTLVCGAECSLSAGETGDVHFFTYDDAGTQTGTVTINFTNADNDAELTGEIATSASGTGWITMAIEIEGTSAGVAGDDLRQIRVQDKKIVSSLAAPVIEGTRADVVDIKEEGVLTAAGVTSIDVISPKATATDLGSGAVSVRIAQGVVFDVDTDDTLSTGLVEFWPLREGYGERRGVLGHLHLPEATAGTVGVVTDGPSGNAAQFDRSSGNHNVEVPANALLPRGAAQDMSVSLWVRLTSKPAVSYITAWQGSGDFAWYVAYIGGGTDRFRFNVCDSIAVCGAAGTVDADTLGSPTTATWYHIVATHDATADTVEIHVNDGGADSVAYTSGIPTPTSPFSIGNDSVGTSTNAVDGEVADVGLWDKVLTAQEITDLYNSGSGNSAGR